MHWLFSHVLLEILPEDTGDIQLNVNLQMDTFCISLHKQEHKDTHENT